MLKREKHIFGKIKYLHLKNRENERYGKHVGIPARLNNFY
jgi:hypothetical protein